MKVILGSDVDGNELKDYIKNYLLGNYGAIPFLQDMKIMEE